MNDQVKGINLTHTLQTHIFLPNSFHFCSVYYLKGTRRNIFNIKDFTYAHALWELIWTREIKHQYNRVGREYHNQKAQTQLMPFSCDTSLKHKHLYIERVSTPKGVSWKYLHKHSFGGVCSEKNPSL
jgi:hypothetical protein